MSYRESNKVLYTPLIFSKRYTLNSRLDRNIEPFDVVFLCKHTIHVSGKSEAFSCIVTATYKGRPFMGSQTLYTTQAIAVRFDIGAREEYYFNDFIIPKDLRNIGVGSFILKVIYDLIPSSIKSGRFVIAGNLPNGRDNTPARNRLWLKAVGPNNIHFSENNFGHFEGRFLDAGDDWKNKLMVTECITENCLD